MSSVSDGGHTALAGFLYQIVVGLGVEAMIGCPDPSVNTDEMEAIFEWRGSGQLHHEYLDSDLAVEHEGEYGLGQLKYSRQVPPETIGPQALLDIVNAFHRSSLQVSKRGMEVTKYVLITNRLLGPEAEGLLDAALQDRQHPELKPGYQYAILQQLIFRTASHWSEWESQLIRFARQFGALNHEIADGIDRLIARVFRKTVEQGAAEINREDLVECFTGCRDARPLTPESVAPYSTQPVNNSPLKPDKAVLRRQLLEETAKATARRALVILYGLGGCGKTIALWQWAHDLTTSSPPDAGAFTAIQLASDVPRNWLAREVSGWGNLAKNPSRLGEEHECVLERLSLSNPDLARPVLFLGLDGLDEDMTAEQHGIVKDILNWFWREDKLLRRELRPPQASLVVTCRHAEDLKEKRWLSLTVSGFPYSGELPESLEVTTFSPSELLAAARGVGNAELYERIAAALQPKLADRLGSPGDDYEPITLERYTTFVPVADEHVVEALMHPAMWRALLELLENDPGSQSQILDGEPKAARSLARFFCCRFCLKAADRGKDFGLDQEDLFHLLHVVAANCQGTEEARYSKAVWEGPFCNAGLAPLEARRLYNEGCSGGLIVKEDNSGSWRWRHRFVADYLAQAEAV